jgi:hypothetical protein
MLLETVVYIILVTLKPLAVVSEGTVENKQ